MIPWKLSCITDSNLQGKAKGRDITMPYEKLKPAYFLNRKMMKKYNTDSTMDAKGNQGSEIEPVQIIC